MTSKHYFDTVAPDWQAMRGEFFSVGVREKAYARAGLAPGMTVVDSAADIGAGSGFISEGLAGRALRVIAVDQSQAMLDELRRRLAPVMEVDTRLGDAERLPLESGSVERAFANMFLHHVEHPAAAIAEMTRILKPGGGLVITDLDSHEHTFLLSEHHDRWPGFEREAVRGWLEAAGLINVTVEAAGED